MDMKFCLPPLKEYKVEGVRERSAEERKIWYIYLLQLGFRRVALVGELLQK